MDGTLKAIAGSTPRATVYRVAGGVALASAIAALAIAALLPGYMGHLVYYIALPLFAALLVWTVVGLVRLWLVGFLPAEADPFIPTVLRPWIRLCLLVRFGLVGSMLLLVAAIIGAAVARGPVNYCVEALVYVVIIRMFLDLIFGTAFNLGIIARRENAR